MCVWGILMLSEYLIFHSIGVYYHCVLLLPGIQTYRWRTFFIFRWWIDYGSKAMKNFITKWCPGVFYASCQLKDMWLFFDIKQKILNSSKKFCVYLWEWQTNKWFPQGELTSDEFLKNQVSMALIQHRKATNNRTIKFGRFKPLLTNKAC